MTYVDGFTKENLDALTRIAVEHGLSPSAVQPNTWNGANGFNVPDSVGDAYSAELAAATRRRIPRKTAPPEKETSE